MVSMGGYCWEYYTPYPNQNSQDLLLYIYDQSTIIKITTEKFIQTIEQDLYKLRKIYESNKSY